MRAAFSFLSIFILIFVSASAMADSKVYGSPEAKVTNTVPTDSQYYKGEAISIVPTVKPVGKNKVKKIRLDMTQKIIDLGNGKKFVAWTFGNEVPGPVIHVREGDKVEITLTNRAHEAVKFSWPMPHSIDFHSAMVSPKDKYRTIAPKQSISFTWYANYPGVFMYHCATPSVLHHLSKGMYGMVIVDPKNGYPNKVDREYAIVQSEFYIKDKPNSKGLYELDMNKMRLNHPSMVVFNGKHNRHLKETLKAKPGERVR